MSHPTHDQAGFISSNSELRLVHVERDYNLNSGAGDFTVNNDNRIIRQKRQIRWHIRGTKEEEAEYDQYGEYRRSDIRLLHLIQRETLRGVDDGEMGQSVSFDCERSIFFGKVLLGEGKGTIVTVVSYEGQDAPERWKNTFDRYSGYLCASNAHLLGLNRSRVPQLILLDELVPGAIFSRDVEKLGQFYLYGLCRHWRCQLEDLWINTARGLICRGPEGPRPPAPWWIFRIRRPVATADLLKEDVLMRYLASFRAQEIDYIFARGISGAWRQYSGLPVPECQRVVHPTVFCSLTNTPIAVANSVWEVSGEDFVERKWLKDGWTRFRLSDEAETAVALELNDNVEGAWVSQASCLFHARGILLEDDLSVYTLVLPEATLEGELSESEVQCQRRLEQPIYLFICLPHISFYSSSFHHTPSLHYWSLQESGQLPLSPDACRDLGLPIELSSRFFYSSWSWPANTYRLLHQYQLLRGFDPDTTTFAQHVEYKHHVFYPIHVSNQFEIVQDCSTSQESGIDTMNREYSTTVQQYEDHGALVSNCNDSDDIDATLDDLEHEPTSDHLVDILQKSDASEGGMDVCVEQSQDLRHSDGINNEQTTEEPFADLSSARTTTMNDNDSAFADPALYTIDTINHITSANGRDSPYADPALYAIETNAMSDVYRPQTVASSSIPLNDLSVTGPDPHPEEDMLYVDDDMNHHRLFERELEGIGTYHASKNEEEEPIPPTDLVQIVPDGTLDGPF
ncbi:hypothetical protein PQX77_016031 [Marasmius sp. AFHP31]|nr:hypothetical protein PQX77_016031 [Marasmius sp. AFHP31]